MLVSDYYDIIIACIKLSKIGNLGL